jgi:pimeloyl-ACP methyl ester carboxylesterase
MASPFEYLRARKQLRRQTLSLRGIDVSYHQQGHGPDFLLVTSSLATIATYMLTIEKLAEHFRVTTVEAPGSGLSSKLVVPWTFAQSAAFLCDVSAKLGLQQPWLAGHSQSGPVVAQMLSQRPAAFAGGILTGAAGAHPLQSLSVLFLGRVLDAFVEPGLVLVAAHHVVLNMLRHFRNFWFQIWQCRGSKASQDLPGKIQVPVLLAWGQHDHEMPTVCAELWAERCLVSQYFISKSASHDFILTQPHAYTAAVVTFVTDSTLACSKKL